MFAPPTFPSNLDDEYLDDVRIQHLLDLLPRLFRPTRHGRTIGIHRGRLKQEFRASLCLLQFFRTPADKRRCRARLVVQDLCLTFFCGRGDVVCRFRDKEVDARLGGVEAEGKGRECANDVLFNLRQFTDGSWMLARCRVGIRAAIK